MQTTTAAVSGGAPRYADAFHRLAEEIVAVPADALTIVNIDVLSAVATTMGVLAEVRALRPRIVEELPRYDLARFDKLEDYALALGHANTLYNNAAQPVEILPSLAEAATELRDKLYSEAGNIAKFGIVAAARLDEYKAGTGYRNLAADLFGLSALFREVWTQIEGKVFTTLSDLDRADNYADEIVAAYGVKEQAPKNTAEASLTRLKAFTLFLSAYDHVRRAVLYLRAEDGDADDIAPSLYAGRGNTKKKASEAKSDVPAPSSGTAAHPDAGPTPARVSFGTTTAAAAAAPATPEGDPFAS